MNTSDGININKKYKDTVFRKLFGESKENALELYNALTDNDYVDTSCLEFTTLDDAIFMKYKNDVSIMLSGTDISWELNLYEHQSTINPNMPLRGFLYFSDLYRQIIPDDERIYGKKLLKIPSPRYIVFYNGPEKDMTEDSLKLRLSDAFESKGPEATEFEWTATVINLNPGHNEDMISRSRALSGYCKFVDTVKHNKETMSTEDAIDSAVDYCIEHDYISDFLNKHRSEVKNMILTKFDEAKYLEVVKNEGREEGGYHMVYGMVQDKDITPEKGAARLGISVEQLKANMINTGYVFPE